MEIEDYIREFEIDMDATEALDYLIELIHGDLLHAATQENWEEAERLRDMIESLPNN